MTWDIADHTCDTLCEIHVQLFDAETDIRIRIDQMADEAVKKLDRMVEAGNKRQVVRELRFRTGKPWKANTR